MRQSAQPGHPVDGEGLIECVVVVVSYDSTTSRGSNNSHARARGEVSFNGIFCLPKYRGRKSQQRILEVTRRSQKGRLTDTVLLLPCSLRLALE